MAVLGAKNDRAAHLAADLVLAGGLQDDRFADGEDRTGQVARHHVFRPVHIF
jgi:hypothetical protein